MALTRPTMYCENHPSQIDARLAYSSASFTLLTTYAFNFLLQVRPTLPCPVFAGVLEPPPAMHSLGLGGIFVAPIFAVFIVFLWVFCSPSALYCSRLFWVSCSPFANSCIIFFPARYRKRWLRFMGSGTHAAPKRNSDKQKAALNHVEYNGAQDCQVFKFSGFGGGGRTRTCDLRIMSTWLNFSAT